MTTGEAQFYALMLGIILLIPACAVENSWLKDGLSFLSGLFAAPALIRLWVTAIAGG